MALAVVSFTQARLWVTDHARNATALLQPFHIALVALLQRGGLYARLAELQFAEGAAALRAGTG